MILFLKRVHAYFYRFNVAILYLLMYPLFWYFSRDPEDYKYMNKMRGFWGLVSSFFTGVLYHFEYEQPIDWSRTYIICPNHVSNLDISAASILTKNNYSFMGKDELKDVFVTALFFKTVDTPVNRESKMSSFRAFKKAGELLDSGVSMIIFPEGKIPQVYPPKLDEFKNGPFRLAIEHKIPIIPVTSSNTWKVLWDDGVKYGSRPGICDIFVHKPIETAHLTVADADALRDEVYDMMKKKLNVA